MKLITSIILLISFNLFGQKEDCTFYSDSLGHKIYTTFTKEAKPLISDNLIKYFSDNIKFESIESSDIEDTQTIIKLSISDNDEVIAIKIIRKGIKGVAEQMFELSRNIKWESAKCGEIKVYSELQIPFQIDIK
jgi:hypothetical protein